MSDREDHEKSLDIRLGELLRDVGLISPDQLDRLLQEQTGTELHLLELLKKEVSIESLKELLNFELSIPFFRRKEQEEMDRILLESGIISDQELSNAMGMEEFGEHDFGKMLVQHGLINNEQLEKIIIEHKGIGLPLWRVLLNKKMISHATIADLIKKRLGQGVTQAKVDIVIDFLMNTGFLTQPQVDDARHEQERTGNSLISVLIDRGSLVLPEFVRAMERVWHIPYYDLKKNGVLSSDMAMLIPEHVVRSDRVLPIRIQNDALVLGMVDPMNEEALQRVRRMTGLPVQPVLINRTDWEQFVGELFPRKAD